MLSVIIPSYKEPYLLNTIDSLLDNATGDIEIIVNVDDGLKIDFKRNDKRVKFHYPSSSLGMRGGINYGLSVAKGNFIMKSDAHCVFAPGFDKELTDNMESDWLVIPRRYSLYADGWKRDTRFPPKDYHYLSYGKTLFPIEWKQRGIDRKDIEIDDTMIMQGSCYLANINHFKKLIGFLDDRPETYSQFGGEQMEVGLKYWLSGGKIKVNKKTWYAHLFKNSRYYHDIGGDELRKHKSKLKFRGGWSWATKHWMSNSEPNMIHPFSYLIEKFWPVPTWPEDENLWQLT